MEIVCPRCSGDGCVSYDGTGTMYEHTTCEERCEACVGIGEIPITPDGLSGLEGHELALVAMQLAAMVEASRKQRAA
jgi:hypothetical protein